ncbi:MAG: DUF4091 domain-containing protein [Bacteroidales bacterium]|nr:DUF4091 domain-containing protein [Bacteroidales bacterium]
MRKLLVSVALLLTAVGLGAQSFTPVENLPEVQLPFTPDAAWAAVKAPGFAWGSLDVRYEKTSVPVIKPVKVAKQVAWRGERVSFQPVLWTPEELHDVVLEVSDLSFRKNVIKNSDIKVGFERYVIGDCLGAEDGQRGYFPADMGGFDQSKRDSVLVPEAILGPAMAQVEAKTARPAWIEVWVPQSATPGTYKGTVKLSAKELKKPLKIAFAVEVRDRVLPKPAHWSFHLDLWQNPYAVARYFGVEPWSDAHLELMRPLMTQLAQGGEKVVTATLMYDCWGPQTLDLFQTMVQVTKQLDGSTTYNYDIFDRWVEFMASCGITEQINCFTIAPWQTRFRYYDVATDSQRFVQFDYGDDAYRALWIPLLKSFADHLRTKGWFDKTFLAVDERGVEVMLKVMAVAHEADPAFKFSLAGNYHPELEAQLADYCIGLAVDDDYFVKTDGRAINDRRHGEGKITTFYTCCGEGHPNTFTISPLAESAALGWYALRNHYDGYLRWAYNSWNKEPMVDTRWYNLTSGDVYLVYPQGWSSVRWERFVEGIQDYEKVKILREEYASQPKKLKKLEDAIEKFTHANLWFGGADKYVNEAKAILNTF